METYRELKDLPITLTANDLSSVLGLSVAGAYNLMNEEGFPLLKIGKRKMVLRDNFLRWLEQNMRTQI